MAYLAPFNPPLGPNPFFCRPTETTLQMREKVFSLTGDDFYVRTVDGLDVCLCKGKVFSISDAKRAFLPFKKCFGGDIPGHVLMKGALVYSIHRPARQRDLHAEEQAFRPAEEFPRRGA